MPRRLEAVLDRDLVRPGGVVRGKFPTAGPELAERQGPQDLRRRRLISLDRRSILAHEKATGTIDVFHLEPVDGYGQRLQPHVPDGAGQLVRTLRMCRRVGIADRVSEEREHVERLDAERGVAARSGRPERVALVTSGIA